MIHIAVSVMFCFLYIFGATQNCYVFFSFVVVVSLRKTSMEGQDYNIAVHICDLEKSYPKAVVSTQIVRGVGGGVPAPLTLILSEAESR